MNQKIKDLFKEQLEDLPVYVRDLDVNKNIQKEKSENLIFVKKHNTKKFQPKPFYKTVINIKNEFEK